MTLRSELVPRWIDPKTGGVSLDIMDAAYAQERSSITDYVSTYTVITLDDSMALSPDAISVRHYGTTVYWWVICIYNNITIIDDEFVMGKRLSIPNLTEVKQWLDMIATKAQATNSALSTLNQRFTEI